MHNRTGNQKQINLMAFPSETTIQFVILFVCCFLVIWHLSDQLIAVYPDILFNGDRAKMEELSDRLEFDNADFSVTIFQTITQNDINYLASRQRNYFELMYLGIKNLINTAIAPLLFVMLCAFIYLVYPALVRFSYKLRPLEKKQQDLDLDSRIRLLCDKSGIVKIPIMEIDKGVFADAQVFGAISPMHIRISRGLQILLQKSKESFDAIALHELSHIINKDVAYTYIAQIAWDLSFSFSLTWTVILIYSSLFRGGSFQYSYPWLLGFIFMFGFIRYNYQNVLTLRELYADWRVAMLGLKDELRSVLKSGSATASVWQTIKDLYHLLRTKEPQIDWQAATLALKSVAMSIWQNIIFFHPSLEERINSLGFPSKQLVIKKDLYTSIGILLGFLLAMFVSVDINLEFINHGLHNSLVSYLYLQMLKVGETANLSSNANLLIWQSIFDVIFSGYILYFFIFLIISLLVAATIGIRVQWFAVFGLSQRTGSIENVRRLFPPAVLFAFGIELGIFFSGNAQIFFFPYDSSTPLYLVVIISITFMTLFIWLWFLWIFLFSRTLYSSHRNYWFPRSRFLLITVTSGLLLAPILYFFYNARHTMLGPLGLAGDYGYPGWVMQEAYLNNVDALKFQAIACILFYFISALMSLFFLWALTAYNKLRKSTCPFCKGHLMYSVRPVICSDCGQLPFPWLFHQGVT